MSALSAGGDGSHGDGVGLCHRVSVGHGAA
jgi:hypothetical protein